MPLSSELIKAEACRIGFSACGLSPADAVGTEAADAFRRWLADGCQAGMAYMQNHTDMRLDPRLLMEGAQTIVSVALNYYPRTLLPDDEYQIAWYAYGKDYHDVMKSKLTALSEYIRGTYPDGNLSLRICCDTAPLLERYWAWRSGLGWIGKNTQLIIPRAGSCFFLGEIILNASVDRYDTPQENRCGTCTRCIDACPAKALGPSFRLNARKCLSYLTIEHRGELPPDTGLKMGKKIYGCDDCQRACSWNSFATPCRTEEFAPSPQLLGMQKQDWHRLTEEQYRTLFKGSAVKRAKYQGLMRNIATAGKGRNQADNRTTS